MQVSSNPDLNAAMYITLWKWTCFIFDSYEFTYCHGVERPGPTNGSTSNAFTFYYYIYFTRPW